MAKDDTVKDMDGIRVELSQPHFNAIEKRLALSGGTMLREIGVDLANRFGTALQEIQELRNKKAYADIRIEQANSNLSRGEQDRDPLDKLPTESQLEYKSRLNKETEKAKQRRVAEEVSFMRAADAWLRETYCTKKEENEKGKLVPVPNTDPNGQIISYGDRIEMKRGHLKKIW
jgi:hypothetical protein